MKSRVLVTGGNGLLGSEIRPRLALRHEVVSTDLQQLDVTDRAAVDRAFDDVRPATVVHCAAYTAVDRAETEREKAFLVNEVGTRNMAAACARHGCRLVTYGTDYVFDGTLGRPYLEDDATNPLSVYGASKLAAERACAASGAPYLMIRTQWLFGLHGRNFVLAILERARKGEPLRVVDDQTGCPTLADDLAEATVALLETGAAGIVHFSSGGWTNWFDFARLILEETGTPSAGLSRISTRELAMPAPRPAFSPLDKRHYTAVTGRHPRPWEDAAREYLGRLR